MEQARIGYISHLGLWNGGSFLDVGIILADARLVFKAPVLFGQKVRVGVRVKRLGNKSLDMEYCLEDAGSGRELAIGSTVLVAYDYRAGRTIPIPEDWCKAIAEFEGFDLKI
jgi:acyl-CoA thioester hydrolase